MRINNRHMIFDENEVQDLRNRIAGLNDEEAVTDAIDDFFFDKFGEMPQLTEEELLKVKKVSNDRGSSNGSFTKDELKLLNGELWHIRRFFTIEGIKKSPKEYVVKMIKKRVLKWAALFAAMICCCLVFTTMLWKSASYCSFVLSVWFAIMIVRAYREMMLAADADSVEVRIREK